MIFLGFFKFFDKCFEFFRKKYIYVKRRVLPESFMRSMIRFIADRNRSKAGLIGVEIGTASGSNADNIMMTLPIKKLYVIDPYEDYVDKEDIVTDWHNSQQMLEAKELLSSYGEKIIFIKKYSDKAVDNIPDNVDFVYIDGNHSYEYVKKDINLYYPKICNGGVLGGHDFNLYGVAKAVIEFSDKYNIKVYNKDSDWWILKP